MPKTVNLTWNNTSSGITEQLVERSVTDGAFVQIGTTLPDQNSFTDNVDEFVGETKLSYKVSSNYIHEGTAYNASSSIFDIVINQSATSNEVHFTTLAGTIDYDGVEGDQIILSDGNIVDVTITDDITTFNVPSGKHKLVLAETRSKSYIGLGGEALVELHNFPTLISVDTFTTSLNYNSLNLVKVPTVLPSNIRHLDWMFSGASSFNQDISMWDTSNVTSMAGMFYSATSFNQDLSSWCVALITTMPTVFDGSASAWTLPRPVWGTCPRGENAQP